MSSKLGHTGEGEVVEKKAYSLFIPTKEQRGRLRYWDFFLYWVGVSVEKQEREKGLQVEKACCEGCTGNKV